MKILLTGASGLLGANFLRHAGSRGHALIACRHRTPVTGNPDRVISVDLSDAGRVFAVLDDQRPDWVVHAAAMTDVDRCQREPGLSRMANMVTSYNLCEAAKRLGIPVLYVSTHAVFRGDRGAYREDDRPDPVNFYAKSKHAAEKIVQAYAPADSLIVRTNFYGVHPCGGGGLVDCILAGLRSGAAIPGFRDVIMNPLLAYDLSEILLDMMLAGLNGIYHVAGSEAISKYHFARRLAMQFGFAADRVYPQFVAASRLRAPRTGNTTLAVDKLRSALIRTMPDIDAGLTRLHQAYLADNDPSEISGKSHEYSNSHRPQDRRVTDSGLVG